MWNAKHLFHMALYLKALWGRVRHLNDSCIPPPVYQRNPIPEPAFEECQHIDQSHRVYYPTNSAQCHSVVGE